MLVFLASAFLKLWNLSRNPKAQRRCRSLLAQLLEVLEGTKRRTQQYLYSVIGMFNYIYLCIYIYIHIYIYIIWINLKLMCFLYPFHVFLPIWSSNQPFHISSVMFAASHKTTNKTSVEVFKSILLSVHLQELLSKRLTGREKPFSQTRETRCVFCCASEMCVITIVP